MFRAAARVYKDGDLVVRDGAVTHYSVWPRAAGDARGRSFDATANEGILRRALRAAVRFHARARRRHRPAAPVRGRRMRALTVNGVAIDDTFAEAFDMRATAIVITAPTARWAAQAAATMTGFATSVIGVRLRGRRRARPVAARNAGRTAGRARAHVRGFDCRSCRGNCKTASGNACSPAQARPATRDSTRARTSSSSARRSVSSATAGRSPSGSAPAGTGACR